MELNLANVIEAFRIAMPHLASPHGSQDQCLYAASFFRGLLAAADVDAEVVGGEYVDADGIVIWGHYATRVGDLVYDWSARQFYPPADWPTIVSWEQWSAHLHIEDRAEFLKA